MSEASIILKGQEGTGEVVAVSVRVLDGGPGVSVRTRLGHSSHDACTSAEAGAAAAYQILRREGYLNTSVLVRYELTDPPANIVGLSAGLGFALAFVTKTIRRQEFPPLAATGIVREDGGIEAVDGLGEKLSAAVSNLSTGGRVFYPAANESDVSSVLRRTAMERQIELVPVNRLDEAISRLGVELRKVYLDSPFRGLQAFEFQHSGIFFGRGAEVREICGRLKQRAEGQTPCLLIVGASGSGKSSLTQAGVLPELVHGSTLPGSASVHWGVFRPRDGRAAAIGEQASAESEWRELATAIVRSWSEHHGLGAELLEILDESTAEDQEAIASLLTDALQRASQISGSAGTATFVWVIDQFEEMFTLGFRTETIRRFASLIGILSRSQVWLLVTLRSDFYDRYQDHPTLVEIFGKGGVYDLLPPSLEQIEQIIAEPARVADVGFETNELGLDLDARIRAEAGDAVDALPLVEFTLQELYLRRDKASNKLTWKAFDELGGLLGSIGSRAETVFEGLPAGVQECLPEVLRALATVADRGASGGYATEITARTIQRQVFPVGSDERALVDALIEARLLVSEAGIDGSKTVRVAHEALFTRWDRAAKQLERDRGDLAVTARLEREAARWHGAPKDDKPSLLLQDGLPLEEAEDLLQRRRQSLEKLPTQPLSFIEASIKAHHDRVAAADEAARQRLRRTQLGVVALATLAVIAAVGAYFGIKGQQEAEQRLLETQQARLLADKRSNDLSKEVAAQHLRAGSLAQAVDVLAGSSPSGPTLAQVAAGLLPLAETLEEVTPMTAFTWRGRTYVKLEEYDELVDIGSWRATSTAANSRYLLAMNAFGRLVAVDKRTGTIIHDVREDYTFWPCDAEDLGAGGFAVYGSGQRGVTGGGRFNTRWLIQEGAPPVFEESESILDPWGRGELCGGSFEVADTITPVKSLAFPSRIAEERLWAMGVSSHAITEDGLRRALSAGDLRIAVHDSTEPESVPLAERGELASQLFSMADQFAATIDHYAPTQRQVTGTRFVLGLDVWTQVGEWWDFCAISDGRLDCSRFGFWYGESSFGGVRIARDASFAIAFGLRFQIGINPAPKYSERRLANFVVARAPDFAAWTPLRSLDDLGLIVAAAISPENKRIAVVSNDGVYLSELDSVRVSRVDLPDIDTAVADLAWLGEQELLLVLQNGQVHKADLGGVRRRQPVNVGRALQKCLEGGGDREPTAEPPDGPGFESWTSLDGQDRFWITADSVSGISLVGRGSCAIVIDANLAAPISGTMKLEEPRLFGPSVVQVGSFNVAYDSDGLRFDRVGRPVDGADLSQLIGLDGVNLVDLVERGKRSDVPQ